MHKYRRAEITHMNWVYGIKMQMVLHKNNPFNIKALVMEGNWYQFGQDCGFEKNKMMRIKLVRDVFRKL